MKVRFRSMSDHTLDGKGRLNFPSRFREVLGQYESEMLMITPWGNGHLRVYPVTEWEILEDKLMTDGRKQPGMSKFIRKVVGGVSECSLDKQGRVLLPQNLRNEVGISREVKLIGMLDYVEIWDKMDYHTENQATNETFEDFDQQLAELGVG